MDSIGDLKNSKDNPTEQPKEKSFNNYFPRRYIVVVLCWLGLFTSHSMRVNVGVTVVTILDETAVFKVGSNNAMNSLPKVTWNPTMIGWLHSIFYVGYIITQIPGGIISRKISCVRIFGFSIIGSCMLNCILPYTIDQNYLKLTLLVRLVQGLFEGFTFPSLYRIMFFWFPQKSSHKYGGTIFGGMFAGPIVGFILDGFIIHYWHWFMMFYLHAILGGIWFVFWVLLIYESPSDHPSISDNELKYVLSSQSHVKMNISYRKMCTSLPLIAAIISNFMQSWLFILMLTNEPAYLNQFQFSLVENGIYAAIPHIIKVIMASISGVLAEMILQRNMLSKTNTRKLFNTLGFGTASLGCYTLSFINGGAAAVTILSLGIGASGLAVSGWQINFLDLAPEMAGVLAGISATFGTLGGILSPIITGIITHPQTIVNWHTALIVTATVLFCGTAFYVMFASGEQQDWSKDDNSEELHLLPSDISKESKVESKDSPIPTTIQAK